MKTMYPSESTTERWFYDQVQDTYDEETREHQWDNEDEDEQLIPADIAAELDEE